MHDEVKSAALNPYEMAVQQFEEAADKLNLSEDMREILRQRPLEQAKHEIGPVNASGIPMTGQPQ